MINKIRSVTEKFVEHMEEALPLFEELNSLITEYGSEKFDKLIKENPEFQKYEDRLDIVIEKMMQ